MPLVTTVINKWFALTKRAIFINMGTVKAKLYYEIRKSVAWYWHELLMAECTLVTAVATGNSFL